MHFQIFIPNQQNDGSTPEQMLAKVGLADLSQGAATIPGKADDSPNQQPGIVIGWQRPGAQQIGLRKEGQTWVPSVAQNDREAGAYWVGFWDGQQPRPEELARRRQLRGGMVELGDGQRWLIPCYHGLPKDVIVDQDGEPQYVQKAEHETLAESAKYWLRLLEGDGKVNYGHLSMFVIDLLKMNYRMTAEVVNQLRLLDTENVLSPLSEFLGIKVTSGAAD